MTYTLKACPFCGGETKLVKLTDSYTTNPVTIRNTWIVKCVSSDVNIGVFLRKYSKRTKADFVSKSKVASTL